MPLLWSGQVTVPPRLSEEQVLHTSHVVSLVSQDGPRSTIQWGDRTFFLPSPLPGAPPSGLHFSLYCSFLFVT